jgi:predicted DNA binding CopG/RHH family protein
MTRTQKVSVALEKDALVAAKNAAAAEGLSLSGLLMKLLNAHFARQARFEAMDRFVEKYAPNVRVSEDDIQAIRDEMAAPLRPLRRRRRKGSAA